MNPPVERTAPAAAAGVGIVRSAQTGALATAAFFVICWVAAALAIPGPHLFVALFTEEPVTSGGALWTGGLCALAAGGLGGLLIALMWSVTGRKG